MKVSRRRALQSAGVLGIATAIGCDDGASSGGDAAVDAAVPDVDGGADAGPTGRDGGPAPTGPFRHGVASGDPLPDAVILWTRVTTEGSADVELEWEMSTDPSFPSIGASGVATATAASDFTAKVDAMGLVAATTYYYRFRVAGTTEVSPIGRTRTAPAADADVARLRFAVCACSSLAHGWFHGYRNIARRADIDLVVHLGDYVYEYGTDAYGDRRPYDPPHEIVSLDDYRRRYRQYREDPDLQEAHRQHPFVTVWDDHESADNSWRDGANNHQPDEGDWTARKRVAQQVYSEYMPVRTTDPERIWRRLGFGRLVELVMLDTRLEGRSEQGAGAADARTLISSEQEEFLIDSLVGTAARWKLIGQQVMFSPFPVVANDDQWDGYPASRARVMSALRTAAKGPIYDVVVLTGDIHSAWAIEAVEDPAADPLPTPAAVELVTAGLTSPPLTTPGSPLERGLATTIARRAPHIKYWDVAHRGYFLLDVTPERAQAQFVRIVDVTAPYDLREEAGETWETATGSSRLTEGTPAAPPADPPPLAP